MLEKIFNFNIKNKMVAIIISAFILASVFVFSFLSAHEIHHDCCGKDCPICAVIHIVNNNFQSTDLTPNIVLWLAEILCISAIFLFTKFIFSSNQSLITQKTCLIN